MAAGPPLVEVLHDPETLVRANAAHSLARLEVLPTGSVAALRECAGDLNDAYNAACALRLAPPGEVADLMDHLLDDPNVRVRLVAAGAVLEANSTTPVPRQWFSLLPTIRRRVREAAEDLIPLLPPIDPNCGGRSDCKRTPVVVT